MKCIWLLFVVERVCFLKSLCVSQYYALQILETVIKTRWKILPRNQCDGQSSIKPSKCCLQSGKCFFLSCFSSVGIKKYVVGLIIKTSSDPANMEVTSP